ncbi:MAG: hypothetical protein JKY52_13030 [Flavobacteriales bacterium]|nr:hypothetical protein [Flavobacteriales bacterium]
MHSQLRGLSFLLVLLASILSTTGSALAQSDSLPQRHSLVIEVAGIGGFWSLSYEINKVTANGILSPYVNAGGSVMRIRNYSQDFDPTFSVPLSVGLLLGAGSNKLDLAFSNTLISEVLASESLEIERKWQVNGAVHIGYRYWVPKRNLFFKIYYAAVLVDYDRFTNWGGLGFGYTLH